MAQNTLTSRRTARRAATRPAAARLAAARPAVAELPAQALPPRPQRHTPASTNTSTDLLSQAARATPDAALTLVASSRSGLTHAEARDRRARFGPNLVPQPRRPRALELAARAIAVPNRLLLLAVAAVSLAVAAVGGASAAALPAGGLGPDAVGAASRTAGIAGALAVGVVAAAVAIEVRRGTRTRSREASASGSTTRVTRVVRGVPVTGERPSVDLVPGDVIELRAGDRAPADVRLLEQHAPAGFSNPTDPARELHRSSRAGGAPGDVPTGVREAAPIALMGERVVARRVSAVVLQTGAGTRLAGSAAAPRGDARAAGARGRVAPGASAKAPRRVRSASATWFFVAALLAGALWGLRAGAAGGWLAAVAAACAVAIAVTPVLLPFVSGIARARTGRRLAELGVVVRDDAGLAALADLDTLVVDKTGTLTRGSMALTRCVDPRGRGSDRVLGWAVTHSHFRSGGHGGPDATILDAVILDATGDDLLRATVGRERIAELPWDDTRQRASVVIHEHDALQVIVTLGAPLTLLDLSAWEQIGDAPQRLSSSRRAQIANLDARLRAEGARTLAVAIREIPVAGPRSREIEYATDDEVQLTFVGLLGFADPSRSSARSAVRAFCARGVDVTLVSGDGSAAVRAVAQTVGLPAERAVQSAETDALTDGQLAALALQAPVFARATAAHKARVVTALSAAGRQVGYLGDGQSDLAAMAAADISIAAPGADPTVQERATVVARDPDLTAVATALREARRLRSATSSYAAVTRVAQLAAVAVALVASLFLPTAVVLLMPLALLVNAIVFGGLAVALVFTRNGVRRPERP